MKVLHLINTLSAGGAEMHLLTLCRHLKKRGVELEVACLREQVKGSRSLRQDFTNDGIRVHHLDADSRYNSRFVGRVMRLLREHRPDVLHTHLPRADFAGAIGKLFNPGMVWISSVHGIYSHHWSGRSSLPVISYMWRRADAMLCISHAVKDWLVGRGVAAEKAKVIHYGIELDKFAKPAEDFRAAWELGERLIIGTIGRLEPGKRHECLIEAMPSICRSVPNAMLLIAGHDPWGHGKELRDLIARLGLQDKVRLLGFQDNIPALLNTLDVFAFASESEGFGQVVIEAMAVGKPAVVSRIAPLTEIVVDGETGLLADPTNPEEFALAVTRLLVDPKQRREMGVQGRSRVQIHFTAERMADETLALYQELIKDDHERRALA